MPNILGRNLSLGKVPSYCRLVVTDGDVVEQTIFCNVTDVAKIGNKFGKKFKAIKKSSF